MSKQIFVSDPHPAFGRLDPACVVAVVSWKVMWILHVLDGVEVAAAFVEWRGREAKNSLGVPSGFWDQANYRSGPDNVAAGYTHEVLVGAEGSTQQEPIAQRPVKLRSQGVRHEPHYFLVEFH